MIISVLKLLTECVCVVLSVRERKLNVSECVTETKMCSLFQQEQSTVHCAGEFKPLDAVGKSRPWNRLRYWLMSKVTKRH